MKKVQSWMLQRDRFLSSSSTSAYCQARSRLPLITLRNIFTHTVSVLGNRATSNIHFYVREVKVVDGTGLSMPDTPKNQEKYPQNGMMKEGCDFPQIKMVAIFHYSMAHYSGGLKAINAMVRILYFKNYGTYLNLET